MAITLEQVVGVATLIGKEITKSKDAQKVLFGKYSDGNPRSFADAVSGEYDSPKTKKRRKKFMDEWEKSRKKKKCKNKRKKKKHKKKIKHTSYYL